MGTGRTWRCRLGWHRWDKRVTDGGQSYLVCRRCDKEDFPSISVGWTG